MDRLEQVQKAAKAKEEGFQKRKPSAVPTKNTRPAVPGLGSHEMPNPSVDGGNFLRHFMYAHPFMDLFEYGASRFTPHKNLRTQNLNYRLLHPVLYKRCVKADFVLRFFVVITVVVLAIIAAAKVLK